MVEGIESSIPRIGVSFLRRANRNSYDCPTLDKVETQIAFKFPLHFFDVFF